MGIKKETDREKRNQVQENHTIIRKKKKKKKKKKKRMKEGQNAVAEDMRVTNKDIIQ